MEAQGHLQDMVEPDDDDDDDDEMHSHKINVNGMMNLFYSSQ